LVAMARRPTWLHTSGGRGTFSVTRRGQRGQFPLAESLGLGRARASLDVRASSASAIPSRAQGVGRSGAVGSRVGEKLKKKEEEGLTAGARSSAREDKKKKGMQGCWAAAVSRLDGPVELVGPGADLGSCRPKSGARVLNLDLKNYFSLNLIQIQTPLK
jgi:hypothetical protein